MTNPTRLHFGLSRSSLALVFGVALLLRLLHLPEAAAWPWHTWDQTDMDTYLRVAHQIQGELLVSRPYHPYHVWQQAIAPAAKWDTWNDPRAFFHVPGYYYFLALVLWLSRGSLTAVLLTQAAMGAAQAALLAAVGARLLGPLAGLVAGLLAATYGPFIAAEAMVLREGPGLFLATAGFAAVVHAWDRSERTEPGADGPLWLAAGVLLGLGALVKETGLVLFAAVTVWAMCRAVRSRPCRWRPVLALSVGACLPWSLLTARNLLVGAGPLAHSSLGSMAFLIGNAADSPSGGVLFDLGPSFRLIMDQSQGALLPTISATLAGYEASPAQYLAHLWSRFSAVWSNVEIPDNYSYQYLLTHSILLQSLPRFVCVWLPAALGIALWVGRRREVRAANTEIPAIPAPMLWLLGSIIAMEAIALSLAPVMARYRLVMVPFLVLPAGGVLAELAVHLGHRDWRSASRLGMTLAIVGVAWALWPTQPVLQKAAIRPADFAMGARFLIERAQVREAYLEFDRGISHARSLGLSEPALRERELLLRRSRLALFLERGRFDAVQEDWRVVSAALPRDPLVREVRRRLPDPGADEMRP